MRVFAFLLVLTSCVDPFNTSTREDPERYVIEGTLTNMGYTNSVWITKTARYSTDVSGISSRVSGAQVRVCDDENRCVQFFEFDRGIYQPANSGVVGVPGRSYHIEVITKEGVRLFSYPEQMLPSPPIARVYYEYDVSTVLAEGFSVYIDVQDPPDGSNFYKWETITYNKYSELCFNRLVERSYPNISSDKNVNGNLLSRVYIKSIPFTGSSPYVVEVYQLALSTRAFEFLNEIRKQVNTEGSIFDPPPSFIRGNLYNPDDPDDVVLGYFMVAGSSKNAAAIDRSKTGLTPRPYETFAREPIYCGDPCDQLCVTMNGGKCGNPPCPPECHYLPGKTSVAPDAWPLPHDPCPE